MEASAQLRNAKLLDRVVVVALRAPLENFPPTLNQVRMLVEAGWRVIVVDIAPIDETSYGTYVDANVERVRLTPQGGAVGTLARLADYLKFRRKVRAVIRTKRPLLVISADPYAMFAVGFGEFTCVWHFHELIEPQKLSRGITQLASKFAVMRARRADFLIFPDPCRANEFQKMVGAPIDVEIAFNCPRTVSGLPVETLRSTLRNLGLNDKEQLVLLQGWLGPSRCVRQIILSMVIWPSDARLVLIGPIETDFRRELDETARQIGVSDRIIFLGRVPYLDLFSLTAGADIGLSLVSSKTEGSLNWLYTAGAVNKRFEYMALGVPQIANTGPGMSEVIEESGAGVLVDCEDPASIGETICALLSDAEWRRRIAMNARQAHLERYCYEKQFLPVLERLEALASKASNT